jgi:uncharacterized UBP type Zn finger protein
MRREMKYPGALLIGLIFLGAFCGCAGRSDLMVNYQVPEASQQLRGQKVHLRVTDQRSTESILTTEAAHQLPDFIGLYNLTWMMPDQQSIQAGELPLTKLFKTVLEKRLTTLGCSTTETSDEATPVLTIALKRVTIDLQDYDWKADLGYDATLSTAGHPTAKETIRGSAERVRIIGRKGADKVLSDIFSDVVNRLDLIKMFKNARLIP